MDAILSWQPQCINSWTVLLTHHSLDKMAAISQMTFSNAFSWVKSLDVLTKISLKFVTKGPTDNNPAFV